MLCTSIPDRPSRYAERNPELSPTSLKVPALYSLFSAHKDLSDEDVPEDNVKIYSNPLFEFDDKYISSEVNPLFNEVLKDIESEDSYVSKLDEPDLLLTPISKLNEDECFDPGGDVDEIELLLR
ncbi:hypothetical protein Tco_0534343 [Tanacetum coccineum]